MRKYLILIFLFQFSFSQTNSKSEISLLYDNEKYSEIIKKYSDKENLNAQELYYVGFSYYSNEDDNNCLKYLKLSIKKDKTFVDSYYLMALELNYLKKQNEAIENLKIAINLNPEISEFYFRLGENYYELNDFENSLNSFKTATEKENCPDKAYTMYAQILYKEKNPKSLEAYRNAKTKIDKESNSYKNVLFNIGLIEIENKNYNSAFNEFEELITLDPTDYTAYSKIIQIHFHNKEYGKAKLLKDKLYTLHKNGKLPKERDDSFCFDKFEYKDLNVEAYERFENESSKIFRKHIFYVINKNGDDLFTIQTEYSPIAIELGYEKYILCFTKDGSRGNFNIGYNDNLDYEILKKDVLKAIEKTLNLK